VEQAHLSAKPAVREAERVEVEGVNTCEEPAEAQCMAKPITFARLRSGEAMVPTMKGISIRVRPSPRLPRTSVVRTGVAANPQRRMPCRFISPVPIAHSRRNKMRATACSLGWATGEGFPQVILEVAVLQ